jgi:hypothetical protein
MLCLECCVVVFDDVLLCVSLNDDGWLKIERSYVMGRSEGQTLTTRLGVRLMSSRATSKSFSWTLVQYLS